MNSGDTKIFCDIKGRSDKSLEKYYYMLVLSSYSLQ